MHAMKDHANSDERFHIDAESLVLLVGSPIWNRDEENFFPESYDSVEWHSPKQ